MSKHFDKLLLCGAVVACAAGIGFYVMKKDDISSVRSAYTGQAPGGSAYKEVPLPSITDEALQWTAFTRPEDDELEHWKYDLFTPVEVSWHNSSKEYRPKGEAVAPIEFGVKLVSLSRPVYRLTLSGSAGAVIFIKADTNGETKLYRTKKGETIKEENVVVTDFKIEEIEMPDGTKNRRPTVTVHDNALNRDFHLTDTPYEFEDIINIVVAKSSDPSVTWTLHKIGDQIKDDELGTFTLKEIDFASKSINLDKLYKPNPRKGPKTESSTLAVEPSKASTSKPASGSTTTRL